MDSSARPAPGELEKFNEKWGGANWEIIKETTSKGDTWIRQPAQPLST